MSSDPIDGTFRTYHEHISAMHADMMTSPVPQSYCSPVSASNRCELPASTLLSISLAKPLLIRLSRSISRFTHQRTPLLGSRWYVCSTHLVDPCTSTAFRPTWRITEKAARAPTAQQTRPPTLDSPPGPAAAEQALPQETSPLDPHGSESIFAPSRVAGQGNTARRKARRVLVIDQTRQPERPCQLVFTEHKLPDELRAMHPDVVPEGASQAKLNPRRRSDSMTRAKQIDRRQILFVYILSYGRHHIYGATSSRGLSQLWTCRF